MGLFDKISPEDFMEFMEPSEEYANKQKTMAKVYIAIFVIYVIIGISSLATFYYLRNWYIIKQRNFKLTFIQGLFAFFSGAITLMVQFTNVIPCPVSLYTSNVVNPFYNSIFVSRSLRIILLYHFNIFKVTALKRKGSKRFKIKESYMGEKEPNYYLPKVYKRVNNIIYAVIAVPTLIALTITIILHANNPDKCPFSELQMSATEQMKQGEINQGRGNNITDDLFAVARIAGIILAIILAIMLFFLAKVKDSSKYGAKFEIVSTIILIVVITVLNAVINNNVQQAIGVYNARNGIASNMLKNMQIPEEAKEQKRFNLIFGNELAGPPEIKLPYKLFCTIFEYTKGGRVLFCIISCYMIFSSIILPIIKTYNSNKEKNKYFREPTSSIQYFYKVLNSPPLIDELKTIAIKEFSVENVLFWENYQVLQKMVYRYQIEFKKAERVGNPRLVSQYDFEGYYQQQLTTFSVSSMDEYSYDPNMPVPRELMPYYVNFYHTFIDSLGPASVNISGATIKQIYSEMCSYPTIGMFDNAKNEIVEMMYSSIFPILLRQNRKQIRNLTIQY